MPERRPDDEALPPDGFGVDIAVGLLLVVGMVLAVQYGSPDLLLRALVVPVVLLVPGHALMRATDTGGRVGVAGRAGLALALSICVSGLAGLVLAGTVGVSASAWADTIGLVTGVASLAALFRGRLFRGRRGRVAGARRRGDRTTGALFCCLCVVGGALGVAEGELSRLLPAESTPVVQLWASAPVTQSGGTTLEVTVHLDNLASASRQVALQVTGGAAPVTTAVVLAPGQQWSKVYALAAGATALTAKLPAATGQPAATVQVSAGEPAVAAPAT